MTQREKRMCFYISFLGAFHACRNTRNDYVMYLKIPRTKLVVLQTMLKSAPLLICVTKLPKKSLKPEISNKQYTLKTELFRHLFTEEDQTLQAKVKEKTVHSSVKPPSLRSGSNYFLQINLV